MREWTREERYRVLRSAEEIRALHERIRASALRRTGITITAARIPAARSPRRTDCISFIPETIGMKTGSARPIPARRRVCTVDRSGMDRQFNTNLDQILDMPLETPLRDLRIFVDKSSAELFANGGGANIVDRDRRPILKRGVDRAAAKVVRTICEALDDSLADEI